MGSLQDLIESLPRLDTLLLVGHEPDFSMVAGQLIGQTDELGRTTVFLYDLRGRLIRKILPNPDATVGLNVKLEMYQGTQKALEAVRFPSSSDPVGG